MAICHFPPHHHLLTTFCFSSKLPQLHLTSKLHPILSGRKLTLVQSSEQPREMGRRSRQRKSDEEICDELREFLFINGLPQDKIPSIKVLSDNGRKDLANFVKRRGSRKVSNLFFNSNKMDDTGTCKKVVKRTVTVPIEDISSSSDLVEKLTVHSNGTLNADFENREIPESSGAFLHIEEEKLTSNGKLDASEAHVKPPLLLESLSDEISDIEDKSSPKATKLHNQTDVISSLKALLHQRELELSQLKQKIEEEKFELLKIQTKAEAKIQGVLQTIEEREREVFAAEEKLKGLKDVQIDFWVEGQTVEVSGSFNGWQHRIKMDLDASFQSTAEPKYRQPVLWSTVLWLYPGVYQIKFIVDGNWRVDPRREVVTCGHVANNVLRVDR